MLPGHELLFFSHSVRGQMMHAPFIGHVYIDVGKVSHIPPATGSAPKTVGFFFLCALFMPCYRRKMRRIPLPRSWHKQPHEIMSLLQSRQLISQHSSRNPERGLIFSGVCASFVFDKCSSCRQPHPYSYILQVVPVPRQALAAASLAIGPEQDAEGEEGGAGKSDNEAPAKLCETMARRVLCVLYYAPFF